MNKKPLFSICLFCILFFFVLLVTLCLSVHPHKIITKAQKHEGGQKGITITIDLCPSSKPYAKQLFQCLDNLGKKQGKPLPIYVCISGKWILKHKKELEKIKGCKNLDIIWVNHSYSHPIENGFLDNPAVNFTWEVQANICLMQQYGLKPSKYFRFPGLVHNPQRLAQLAKMGYVNLDADAWLGKGQAIKENSILLVHGNGNEVPGVIDRFTKYIIIYIGVVRELGPFK